MNERFDFEDNSRPPRRTGGGIGCFGGMVIGCAVVTVLCVLLAIVGGFFMYRFISKGVSTDPILINQWLQEMVECKVPDGYEGKLGLNPKALGLPNMDEDLKVLVFGPVGEDIGEDNKSTIFNVNSTPDVDMGEAFDQMAEEQGKDPQDNEEVVASETTSEEVQIQVGEHQYPATKTVTKGEKFEHVSYSIYLKEGVYFSAHGPADTFDQAAMDSFLQSMKVGPPPPPEKEMEETEEMDETPVTPSTEDKKDEKAEQPKEETPPAADAPKGAEQPVPSEAETKKVE